MQKLSEEENHTISRLKINKEFKPDLKLYNFERVYYFIRGTGSITIDGLKYEINQGNCFFVNKDSIEIVIPENELDFIFVCDKLEKN